MGRDRDQPARLAAAPAPRLGHAPLPEVEAGGAEAAREVAVAADQQAQAARAGGGYASATLEAPSDYGVTDSDRTEWIAGVSVSMQGITVSGNYSVDDLGKSTVSDRTTMAVGASTPWTFGDMPLTLGVTFVNTERSDSDNTTFSLGVSHSLGAGVSIAGELQFWDIDAVDDTMDNRATVAIIGTRVGF